MAAPLLTVTANLQKITGAADAASVQYSLVNFTGVPRVSGTAIIVQVNTAAAADGSGNTSVTLWALDQIAPANCLYRVSFFDDQGNIVGSPVYYVLNAAGVPATVDISTQSPVSPLGVPIVPPVSSFPANQVAATPNGSSGPLGVRALVQADLPAIDCGSF